MAGGGIKYPRNTDKEVKAVAEEVCRSSAETFVEKKLKKRTL